MYFSFSFLSSRSPRGVGCDFCLRATWMREEEVRDGPSKFNAVLFLPLFLIYVRASISDGWIDPKREGKDRRMPSTCQSVLLFLLSLSVARSQQGRRRAVKHTRQEEGSVAIFSPWRNDSLQPLQEALINFPCTLRIASTGQKKSKKTEEEGGRTYTMIQFYIQSSTASF